MQFVKSILTHHICKKLLLVALFFSCSKYAFAQLDTMVNGVPILRPEGTTVAFFMDDSTVTINPGEIISKTVILYNLEDKVKNIRINISAPPEWKRTAFSDRVYQIKGGEILYLPASIIPNGKIKGNTKYLLTVYITDEAGPLIGSMSFFAYRNRLSNWDISLNQKNRIYFKNKEHKTKFSYTIYNSGNEEQPISMSIDNYRTNVSITDSSGKIIQGKFTDYILPVGGDTTFTYNVSTTEGVRNQRFIDTESHRPTSTDETKTQSIYVKTSESKTLGNKALQKNKKIDFIQLGNEIKVSPYGYSYFPLTVEANINSIATGSPLANIFMRGNTMFDNGTSVNYQLQTFFTNNYYTSNYLDYTNYFVGISNSKYTVTLGNISGIPEVGATMPVPGRGAGAIYRINKNHSVGAFYTRSPGLFNNSPSLFNRREGYGFSYGFKVKTFNINTAYTRADYSEILGYIADYWEFNTSKSFFKNQSLTIGGMLSNNTLNNGSRTSGYIVRGGYTGQFLSRKQLNTSTSLTYISRNFNYLNNGDGWIGTFNTSYNTKKRMGLQLNSNFNKRILYFSQTPSLIGGTSYLNINNQLSVNRSYNSGFISVAAFYNLTEINNNEIRSRGLSLNVGNFEYDKNKLYSGSVMAGYSKPMFLSPVNNYFFFQMFGMIRYKVLSGFLRYSYGNIGSAGFGINNIVFAPQLINANINHQHQFRDSHFILQQFLSYSYYNLNQRQTLSYMPELSFYTNNDWRFRIQIGYYLASTNSSGALIVPAGSTGIFSEESTLVSQNVMANIGIRKSFGIKNPLAKSNFYSANIKAFVDINGNKKRDNDEYLLENVVVRVNGWDVLTNEKGEARLKNMPGGLYEFSAFSLDEIKDYFPEIADTILITRNYVENDYIAIPFVKGVKIYGKVVVDRDLLSQKMELIPEIGGIKITAENGRTVHTLTENDGSFTFYAPYGDYKIIFDEKVLGTRYRLMENNIPVKIDKDVESIFITFNIIEKRRRVTIKKFNANGESQSTDSSSNYNNGNTNGSVRESSINNNNSTDTTALRVNTPTPAIVPTITRNNPLTQEQIAVTDDVLDKFLRNKIDVTNTRDLIYTVQIGAFMKPLNPNAFNNINDIMYELIGNNFVRITSGQFNNEADCIKTLTELSARGFEDAFISAYYNGRKVTLDEARQLKK
jgi:hypothetical protein